MVWFLIIWNIKTKKQQQEKSESGWILFYSAVGEYICFQKTNKSIKMLQKKPTLFFIFIRFFVFHTWVPNNFSCDGSIFMTVIYAKLFAHKQLKRIILAACRAVLVCNVATLCVCAQRQLKNLTCSWDQILGQTAELQSVSAGCCRGTLWRSSSSQRAVHCNRARSSHWLNPDPRFNTHKPTESDGKLFVQDETDIRYLCKVFISYRQEKCQ